MEGYSGNRVLFHTQGTSKLDRAVVSHWWPEQDVRVAEIEGGLPHQATEQVVHNEERVAYLWWMQGHCCWRTLIPCESKFQVF